MLRVAVFVLRRVYGGDTFMIQISIYAAGKAGKTGHLSTCDKNASCVCKIQIKCLSSVVYTTDPMRRRRAYKVDFTGFIHRMTV